MSGRRVQALVRAAMANCVQRLRHEGSQDVCTLCRLCAGVSSDGAVPRTHTHTHAHTQTHTLTHCGRGVICLLKPQDTVERLLSKILMGIGRGDRQRAGQTHHGGSALFRRIILLIHRRSGTREEEEQEEEETQKVRKF